MRAVVLTGKQTMQMETRELAPLLPHEVRIRVKACGICGTDVHIYHGHPGSAAVNPPIVLGHELAGEVTEVGSAVRQLRTGDRVSVDPNIYCGNCRFCRNGRPQLCSRLQAIGVTRDGGMGEYASVPEANCYPIPDGMTFAEAALVEPLGCVLHGFGKLDVRSSDKVLVIGGGFIGQLFLQLVRRRAVAGLAVCEPVADKHRRLIELGADIVMEPADLASKIEAGQSFDIVIECVGRKESMESAVKAAGKGAQVLLFGVSSPEVRFVISPFDIFSRELKIMGSFINPHTHEEAIALIGGRAVEVEKLISHRFRLEDIAAVMGRYSELKATKGVIVY